VDKLLFLIFIITNDQGLNNCLQYIDAVGWAVKTE